MKKLLVSGFLLAGAALMAQNGMDNDNSGGAGNHFSRLSTPPQANNYERALGVYQKSIFPASFLEVNTNSTHFTNYPAWGLGATLGEVFRTSSPVDAFWRMRVGGGQVGALYSTGTTNFNLESSVPAIGAGNMLFRTGGATERMRILGNTGTNTSGYIGINNPFPDFHVDMITPAFTGGELFYDGRPSDVVNSHLGFCNGAFNDNIFLPIVFGNVDVSQSGPGLQTVGNIHPVQDIAANNASWAITRFVSGTGWIFNQVGIQPVKQRHLFSWSNASDVKMLMDVKGNLRIMDNMNTLVDLPNNRLEITAGPGNPYFPVGPAGASGLRLTSMTSANIPVANPGQGVLAVDANGDVIYVKSSSAGGGVTLCNTIPINNVTKNIGGNVICTTNITDLFPVNNVGVNNTAPNDALDVGLGNSTGHIDINNWASALKINDQQFLWNRQSTNNIFLGYGAGISHAFGSNVGNIFIGTNAGAGHLGLGLGNNVVIGNNAAPAFSDEKATIIGTDAAGLGGGSGGVTYIGYRAGYSYTPSGVSGNVFVGRNSGFSTLGGSNDNTFTGTNSGLNNISGDQNNFFGISAGVNNTTGSGNSFVGALAGAGNTIHFNNNCFGNISGAALNGDNNVILGNNAAPGVMSYNVIAGNQAMGAATAGGENVVLGYLANSVSPGTNHNVIIGCFANQNNNNGSTNTFVGYQSAFNQTTGDNNANLGDFTGINVSNGNKNMFLGSAADATNPNSIISNASAIGWNAKVTNSDDMILGNNKIQVGIGLSGDPAGPLNNLEIDAGLNGTFPSTAGLPGASGLRFRDLRFNNLEGPSNGKVLTVDINGDVILVNDSLGSGGGPQVGGYCSNTNALTNDYEIPLGTFVYRYTGQAQTGVPGSNQDLVSVGYPCTVNPPSRLSVWDDNTFTNGNETYAGHFRNDNLGNNATITGGIFGMAKGLQVNPAAQPPINIGGLFEGYGTMASIGACGRIVRTSIPDPSAPAPFARYAIGGAFMSDTMFTNNIIPAVQNIGVYGRASNSNVGNYGGYLHAEVTSGVANYGVYAAAGNGTVNYGIYATVPNNSGGTGIGAPPGPDYAGFFNGDVFITNMFGLSDKNLKKNISKIANANEIIAKLNPVTYLFDQEKDKNVNLPEQQQYGFISQEVQKVLPELTAPVVYPAQYDNDGKEIAPKKEYLGLNYLNFIGILTKGMQEQQATISEQNKQLEEQKKINEDLKNKMDRLEQLITSCCSNNSATENKQTINLSDKNVIVLNQNVPNPFAESTTITYNIPENFVKAQLIFSTSDGKVIKSIDITAKGEGRLNVFANDLSSGMYYYTLVIDGKNVASKKMVKE
jgi:hypothetical protein